MKWLKHSLFILVCLGTLVGLFYAIENWRGQQAWAQWQRQREAQGDQFEWASLAPPALPETENLAAAPVFAELFAKPASQPRLAQVRLPNCQGANGDWRLSQVSDLAKWRVCFTNEDLRAALRAYEPILTEVDNALERPACRFPIRYEEHIGALLPHLTVLRQLSRVYVLRATVALDQADPGQALADIEKSLRLADCLRDEPITISYLVRCAQLELSLQPIWEGLRRHQWSEPQLARLQALLANHDEVAACHQAMRGERMFGYHGGQWIRQAPAARLQQAIGQGDKLTTVLMRAMPRGWIDQNMLAVDRFWVEQYLPVFDLPQKRIDHQRVRAVSESSAALLRRRSPHTILCALLLPALDVIPQRAAWLQSALDQAAVACALERYRLAHGQLPERLEQLVPRELDRIPHDVLNGQPPRYRREAADKFTLWNVGWNLTDDGGLVVAADNRQRLSDQAGDWVWRQ